MQRFGKILKFRLSDAMAARLAEVAARQDRTASDVVRQALRKELSGGQAVDGGREPASAA